MKKIVIIIIATVLCFVCKAQSEIEIAMVVPVEQESAMNANLWQTLNGKMHTMITRNGVSAAEYSGIVMYPQISVLNEQTVEGGMKNITIIDLQLTLTCENVITNTVYNSQVFYLRGEGTANNVAKMKAINNINPNNEQFAQFIKETKQKIVNYYQNNMAALLDRAKTLASMQQYGQAIALLNTFPISVSGYKEVNNAIIAIYKQYQQDNCKQFYHSAYTAYSSNDYQRALSVLEQIDMQSPCANDAKTLCNTIKQQVEEQTARQAEQLEKMFQSYVDLESKRIKACRDIAVEYYKSACINCRKSK
ncbi:MAG: hypothetical protein IJ759_05775 [Bacteroidales bacterium]|nr:hypothetical protein [Bacteroidales bacterium]